MKHIHQRKKVELVYMATHRCEHRHTFIEHPQCYQEGRVERVGYLDIETSNLDADYGIILTWAILDDTGKIVTGEITPADIKKGRHGDEDRRVTQELLDAMVEFDRLITFYGARFDVPYIRTRALAMGLVFPLPHAIKHTDVYFVARHKLRLSSNRLANVCRTLLGKTEKTVVQGPQWRDAARGDKGALQYVMDHNIKDVRDLKRIYDKLLPYMQLKDTSA